MFGLFLLGGWKKETLTADIVPLFETIDDLQEAESIMEFLYSHPVYKQHLKQGVATHIALLYNRLYHFLKRYILMLIGLQSGSFYLLQ